MKAKISPISKFKARIGLPGDKSISHRALILGAVAEGRSEISNLLISADVEATIRCLEQLGIRFDKSDHKVIVYGKGLQGLLASPDKLDCGNSGTTIRLLMGLLAGQMFQSVLIGDESISKRPMKRVAEPLIQMGAAIYLTHENYAPLKILGHKLHGIDYELPVASAQVKSAILLAGLNAEGETALRGRINSRDHTERLLAHLGAKIRLEKDSIALAGQGQLCANKIDVPGDISAASFWMAAATITPGASVEFDYVGLNQTRMGFLNLLRKMGADVEWNITSENPEPCGRLRVSSASIKGVEVTSDEVPYLIDEIPLVAVLGVCAHGVTKVTGAGELRFKESNRIDAITRNLKAMGAEIEVFDDGFEIAGPQDLRGGQVDSMGDHRIAMAFSVLGLRAKGETEISNAECVETSYPDFYEVLGKLGNG